MGLNGPIMIKRHIKRAVYAEIQNFHIFSDYDVFLTIPLPKNPKFLFSQVKKIQFVNVTI